jgi:mevalonate kinase
MSTASELYQVTTESYSAHGKFLLTGEYAVLDNVDALAIPLRLDQRLHIEPVENSKISWKSYNVDGNVWYDQDIELSSLNDTRFKGSDPISQKLIEILRTALRLIGKTNFTSGLRATTQLDFDRKSGMGTSSTLIHLISNWLGCNAYELQFECFGGSGYDIACAGAGSPIVYNYNDGAPKVSNITYQPRLADQLYFVYLNQKQDSRKSIASFDNNRLSDSYRKRLNEMPKKFLETEDDLQAFQKIIEEHENIIADIVQLEPVKQRLFKDFSGAIKSLGGWGGDFVMAAGPADTMDYFRQNGYEQIHRWNDIVL